MRTHSSLVAFAGCLLGLYLPTVAYTDQPRGYVPSPRAQEIASYATNTYAESAVQTLAELVEFATFHPPDLDYSENPEFLDMRDYLERKAAEFGFDFEDLGPLVVIGLGDSTQRIGVVAHGDVQPADRGKWAADPFTLDTASEPGRLVGRGTEDDKGPLVNALYAMKSLKDRRVPLARRIELIVAWTEEHDWTPIRKLLETWEPPQINIAFDASYPVVVAEKGWGQIKVTFPARDGGPGTGPTFERMTGGAFLSQVPEDAVAEISAPTRALVTTLENAAALDSEVEFTFEREANRLIIRAHGVSAHSSVPEDGKNALTHLAALLGQVDWPATAAATLVDFVNDLVGTGHYAEQFGDLAHSHPFMGPLTLTLATVEESEGDDGGLTAGLSFRRPLGRTRDEIESAIARAIANWQSRAKATDITFETKVYDPYSVKSAPQVPVLLDVFRHYTGTEDAEVISMGGGTNASLLPNGVSFGPSMPGAVYTGHTEHEFITRDQFKLDLQMYTAALTQLAAE